MVRRFSAVPPLVALVLAASAALALANAVPAQARPAFRLTVTHPDGAVIGDTVAMRATVRRAGGAAIKGARVRFTWNIAGAVHREVLRTNARGVAVSRALMTCGGTVRVRVERRGPRRGAHSQLVRAGQHLKRMTSAAPCARHSCRLLVPRLS